MQVIMASLAAEGKDAKVEVAAAAGAPHALQSNWSLWEHRENKDGSWNANFHKLCDFNTVEDFWKYWSHIVRRAHTRPRHSRALFSGALSAASHPTISYPLGASGYLPEEMLSRGISALVARGRLVGAHAQMKKHTGVHPMNNNL